MNPPIGHLIPSNLVVNADDFGLNPSVSRAILKAAEAGLVNSVSAVAGCDSESQALLQTLAAIPGLRIGAHLALIEIRPLTAIPGFSEGLPHGFRAFLKPYFLGKLGRRKARDEWRAQLLWLRERVNRPLSHLDSHQHLHLLPGLWQAAQELRREFGIPEIRVRYESGLRPWLKDPPFGAALQMLSGLRHGAGNRLSFGTGMSMAFRAEGAKAFAGRVSRERDARFELIVHPREDAQGRQEMEELGRWLRLFAR